MSPFHYPPTRTMDQVDDYHGARVADPYRWLEDVDSPEALDWIKRQNELTFAFLDSIPARAWIRARLTELWDYARASAPFKRGGRYFQFRNGGLQNQDVLVVLDALQAEPRRLLDPNTLSADGTVALNTWAVSRDGRWLAYALSASGSDWQTWRVRDVTTGEDLPEVLEWSKFGGAAWLNDGSGFYYTRYAPPAEGQTYQGANYDQQLYFHRLGTPQREDALVYERPDHPEWGFAAQVSDDGRYLILQVWEGTDSRNRLFYQDLQTGGGVVELIAEQEAAYHFVGNAGPVFYLRTDLAAPCGRLMAIDTANSSRENWRTLVAASHDVLESVRLVHDQFIALYLHDAHHLVQRFDLGGQRLGEIALPAPGSLLSLTGEREDDELFYAFNSFVQPATVYRYDFAGDASQLVWSPALQFDPTLYETEQVFAVSKDSTRVPMFLMYRRGLVKDGRTPTLLYGYGGFDISLTPTFAASRLAWLEMGGVLAVANLRGGGEYGQVWHQAGMLDRKQNVFDDFIACAEYLIAEKITSMPRLAIHGGSNGGLLVGACMTQRPDLFGAAMPAVGVMDMLRFHKFTIGWAWASDYGCADDPEQFKTLVAYSPLHHVRAGTAYPATLVVTADHDDRVVPGHSFKFAAALQAAQAGDAPVLIRIQTRAGHGAGKPTRLIIEEAADMWAFLVRVLGMEEGGL
jgi:prolyl oligopeptidase